MRNFRLTILIMSFYAMTYCWNGFPYQIQHQSLDNGFNIYVVPMNTPGVMSYYTVVRAGSRNEIEPGKTGFAHFFEHMMFRGTIRYPEDARARVIRRLGADSNAFTTEDYTCYHITATKDSLETIMDLESDRFQNLTYSIQAFQKEAGAILGEYNKSATSPYTILSEKMQALAFKKHTYRHTVIGFLKDIKDMPNQYEYSLTFYKRYYRPENCSVVIAGDVDPQTVFSLAEKYYSKWKTGAVEPKIPPEPEQMSERRAEIEWQYPTQPILYIGYHVPGFSQNLKDYASLRILADYLFSEKSALYKQLVLEEQTVEALSADASPSRDPGLFTIFARIKRIENLSEVENKIFQAIRNLSENLPAPDIVEDIKSHVEYGFLMNLNKPSTVAYYLSSFISLTNTPSALDEYYSAISQVVPEDIQDVAVRYLKPSNRNIVILRQGGVK